MLFRYWYKDIDGIIEADDEELAREEAYNELVDSYDSLVLIEDIDIEPSPDFDYDEDDDYLDF